MPQSVGSAEAAKSVRNGLYLLDDDAPISRREQLHHLDDDEAAVLGRTLASDEVFQRKCEVVAESPIEQRLRTAEREAEAYAPYRDAHRDLIVELLLTGAVDDYPERFAGPVSRFRVENRKRRSIWPDDERERDDEPRRWRDRMHRLEQGALRVARLGAGRCIGCGRQLAGDRFERGSDRRARRWYCSPTTCPKARTERIQNSQRESMRDAFDAATGQRRARRTARRKAR